MAEETAAVTAPAAVAPEIKELGDKLVALTVLQARDLKDYLKNQYGIEPAAGGKVIKRGKLKLWTGDVPSIPLAEAVETARHYER